MSGHRPTRIRHPVGLDRQGGRVWRYSVYCTCGWSHPAETDEVIERCIKEHERAAIAKATGAKP